MAYPVGLYHVRRRLDRGRQRDGRVRWVRKVLGPGLWVGITLLTGCLSCLGSLGLGEDGAYESGARLRVVSGSYGVCAGP